MILLALASRRLPDMGRAVYANLHGFPTGIRGSNQAAEKPGVRCRQAVPSAMGCGERPLRGRRALVTGAATGTGVPPRSDSRATVRQSSSTTAASAAANEVLGAIATAGGNAQAIPPTSLI